MWNRERIERLHGFYYRVEIYVPQPKRIHGYYVFPFLLDDDFVARVDLKADRKAGVLRVLGAFAEDGAKPVRVARELAVELGRWRAGSDSQRSRSARRAILPHNFEKQSEPRATIPYAAKVPGLGCMAGLAYPSSHGNRPFLSS